MSVSVSMPQLGESVTEGTVTRWLKKEGERVEADEPLLEVSTDKVDTEIPSPVAGILRGITVAEDETVEVGAELAVIDETGAEGQPAEAPADDGYPEQQYPAEPAPDGQAEPASPGGTEPEGFPYPSSGLTGQHPVPAQAGYQPGGYPQQGGYQPAGYGQQGDYQPAAYDQGGNQPQAPAAGPPPELGSQASPPAQAPAAQAQPASAWAPAAGRAACAGRSARYGARRRTGFTAGQRGRALCDPAGAQAGG